MVMVKNDSTCDIGTLSSDQVGEYVLSEFNAFLAELELKH